MTRIRRLVAALAVTAGLVAGVAPSAAAADDTTTSTTAPASTATSERTPSLAAALIAMAANRNGGDVASFVGLNAEGISSLTGAVGGPRSLVEVAELMPSTMSTQTLTAHLADAGAAFDWSRIRSYDELTSNLATHAGTLDGRVTLASASWANQLATLHMPAVSSPGQLDANLGQGVPEEGLAFGLAMNASFAALATDFPDLFDDVMSSGLGTPERADAWNRSMLSAAMNLPSSAGDIFSPCTVSMMNTALTGSTSGPVDPRCGACDAAGEFLSGQLASTLNPGFNRTLRLFGDGVLTNGDVDFIETDWLREAAPADGPRPMWMFESTTSAAQCATASRAVEGTLGRTVPDVFSGLRNRD